MLLHVEQRQALHNSKWPASPGDRAEAWMRATASLQKATTKTTMKCTQVMLGGGSPIGFCHAFACMAAGLLTTSFSSQRPSTNNKLTKAKKSQV
ncbi:hypothetical protein DUNSADRAFT_15023 [Dunaliella salina]|uniref:Encoded protein n=1 Tax=Dunaliella salina TaxID=3046 RepID=A0ABQ7G665_DUNSA|nr:hypothetical protein DUNSADRAFT_15023 [Dunaliella salina]|eukprot:KAF5830106.1 hypothetical protein DUNSADRAFT_15023 [Dunaliella salina]